MEKYCLTRINNNVKVYFKGKLIRQHDKNFDYWEGNFLTPQMNICTYKTYKEALFMKIECLFKAKKFYKISLIN